MNNWSRSISQSLNYNEFQINVQHPNLFQIIFITLNKYNIRIVLIIDS